MKIAVIIFLLSASAAFAQGGPPPAGPGKPGETFFSLGGGAVWVKSIYRGADDTFMPIPVIIYREGRFSFNGLGGSYDLVRSPVWDLSAGLGIRFTGFDPDESEYLEGMRERKKQVNLGTGLRYKNGKNSVSLRLSFDLNNYSNGWQGELAAGRAFGGRKIIFHPAVKAVYESRDRANLNYGVYRSEARADRPYYRLPDAVSLGAEGNLILNWENGSSTFLRFEWQALNSKIIRSPIINSSYALSVIAAHTWKF